MVSGLGGYERRLGSINPLQPSSFGRIAGFPRAFASNGSGSASPVQQLEVALGVLDDPSTISDRLIERHFSRLERGALEVPSTHIEATVRAISHYVDHPTFGARATALLERFNPSEGIEVSGEAQVDPEDEGIVVHTSDWLGITGALGSDRINVELDSVERYAVAKSINKAVLAEANFVRFTTSSQRGIMLPAGTLVQFTAEGRLMCATIPNGINWLENQSCPDCYELFNELADIYSARPTMDGVVLTFKGDAGEPIIDASTLEEHDEAEADLPPAPPESAPAAPAEPAAAAPSSVALPEASREEELATIRAVQAQLRKGLEETEAELARAKDRIRDLGTKQCATISLSTQPACIVPGLRDEIRGLSTQLDAAKRLLGEAEDRADKAEAALAIASKPTESAALTEAAAQVHDAQEAVARFQAEAKTLFENLQIAETARLEALERAEAAEARSAELEAEAAQLRATSQREHAELTAALASSDGNAASLELLRADTLRYGEEIDAQHRAMKDTQQAAARAEEEKQSAIDAKGRFERAAIEAKAEAAAALAERDRVMSLSMFRAPAPTPAEPIAVDQLNFSYALFAEVDYSVFNGLIMMDNFDQLALHIRNLEHSIGTLSTAISALTGFGAVLGEWKTNVDLAIGSIVASAEQDLLRLDKVSKILRTYLIGIHQAIAKAEEDKSRLPEEKAAAISALGEKLPGELPSVTFTRKRNITEINVTFSANEANIDAILQSNIEKLEAATQISLGNIAGGSEFAYLMGAESIDAVEAVLSQRFDAVRVAMRTKLEEEQVVWSFDSQGTHSYSQAKSIMEGRLADHKRLMLRAETDERTLIIQLAQAKEFMHKSADRIEALLADIKRMAGAK